MFKKSDAGLIVIRRPDQASFTSRAIDDLALSVPEQDETRSKRIRQFDRRLQCLRKLIQEAL